MIGASGAISGVLGAYLVLYPRAKVLVLLPLVIFITTVRVPALVVLGIWFGAALELAPRCARRGGVAFAAHVGGFVAGVVLIRLFLRDRRRPRRRSLKVRAVQRTCCNQLTLRAKIRFS